MLLTLWRPLAIAKASHSLCGGTARFGGFFYIINLKLAITIYYNINGLNSLSSFCYLAFFIRFLSAAIRTDAVLFLEATKQLGAMLNSCRSSLKNL